MIYRKIRQKTYDHNPNTKISLIIIFITIILLAAVIAEGAEFGTNSRIAEINKEDNNDSNIDAKNADTKTDKTVVDSQIIAERGNIQCIEYWKCTLWSECSKSGEMTRICVDKNSCNTKKKNFSVMQNCTYDAKIHESDTHVLFDIILDVVEEPTSIDKNLIAKISLINFGSSDAVVADLDYTISNSDKKIVREFHKTVLVKTQVEFMDTINTTGLESGKYYLGVELKYPGQRYPALTEKNFNIGNAIDNASFFDAIFSGNGMEKGLIAAMILCVLLICNAYYRYYIKKLK